MNYHSGDVELNDMKEDVYETTNVSEEHPEIVKDLNQKLKTLNQKCFARWKVRMIPGNS